MHKTKATSKPFGLQNQKASSKLWEGRQKEAEKGRDENGSGKFGQVVEGAGSVVVTLDENESIKTDRKSHRTRIYNPVNANEKLREDRISFHNYKQTGIKSRPVKLLEHPFEHIGRKIILTTIISLLSSLIVIMSGPPISLLAFLLISALILIRRSTWFLLNLTCLSRSKIKTSDVDDDDWTLCPLSYLESFWFREKLVNNVILVIDNEDFDSNNRNTFSIDKLRETIRDNILRLPQHRKFLCRVVPFGLPLYKSYFWQKLPLASTIPVPDDLSITDKMGQKLIDKEEGGQPTGSNISSLKQRSSSASRSSSSQFSIRSASSKTDMLTVEEFMKRKKNSLEGSVPIEMQENGKANRMNEREIYLSDHIYMDSYLLSNNVSSERDGCKSVTNSKSNSLLDRAKIRQYAYNLMVQVNLDMTRPLWEIRVCPSCSMPKRTYLIFRCHQSLADGHCLSTILTDYLSVRQDNSFNENQSKNNKQQLNSCFDGSSTNHESQVRGAEELSGQGFSGIIVDENEARDRELKLISEKRSFVSRVGSWTALSEWVLVGPLTVLLWIIWTFSRRKNNHLNKCINRTKQQETTNSQNSSSLLREDRRLYMTHYDLTKFYQIKKKTRSTVSDVILCALSGALRDYLRKFNGVSNPPTLIATLTVNMRRGRATSTRQRHQQQNRVANQDDRQQGSHQEPLLLSSRPASAADVHPNPACPAGLELVSVTGGSETTAANIIGLEETGTVIMMEPSNVGVELQKSQLQPSQTKIQIETGDQNQIKSIECHQRPPSECKRDQESQVNCTLLNVPLPSSVEGTVPRLWELKTTMDELRRSADLWVMLNFQKFLFHLLPTSLYQRLINYIVLRNSSILVSNIRGPLNLVESWCIDSFQRDIYEAQQALKSRMFYSLDDDRLKGIGDKNNNNNKTFSPEAVGSDSQVNNNINKLDSVDNNDKLTDGIWDEDKMVEKIFLREEKRKVCKNPRAEVGKLRLINKLGTIKEIYYCMQAPTSEIPISFNCITYHNKLFVTSLSRSLLVEDSKLLIKLFFAQLNQLANRIAKRECSFTIIKMPIPIEISCQPASPILGKKSIDSGCEDNEDNIKGKEFEGDDNNNNNNEDCEDDDLAKQSENSISSSEIGTTTSEIDEDDNNLSAALPVGPEKECRRRTQLKRRRRKRQEGEGDEGRLDRIKLNKNNRAKQPDYAGGKDNTKTTTTADGVDLAAVEHSNKQKASSNAPQTQPPASNIQSSGKAAKTAKLNPSNLIQVEPGGLVTKRQQQQQGQRFMRDDIEADLLDGNGLRKCLKCKQFACTCRRRRSLFSADTNQRSNNLLSLLHPNYYFTSNNSDSTPQRQQQQQLRSKSIQSNELGEPLLQQITNQHQQQQQQYAAECLCGQRLLEELDEDLDDVGGGEGGGKLNSQDNLPKSGPINRPMNDQELSRESIRSRTPSDDAGRLLGQRAICAKCRYNSARSLMSLSEQEQQQQEVSELLSSQAKHHNKNRPNRVKQQQQHLNGDEPNGSNLSLSSINTSCLEHYHKYTRPNSSAVLHLHPPPTSSSGKSNDSPKVSKYYSKSETDLLPFNKAPTNSAIAHSSFDRRTPDNESITNVTRGELDSLNGPSVGKESWFVLGRKGNRKISTIFSRSAFNSSFKIRRNTGSSSPVSGSCASKSAQRNFIGTSIDLINTHMPLRRRQSVATTTGASSNIHKSIVIKDETNADVNLRYHRRDSLSDLLGIRTRRFSTIGGTFVGTQRRSSLIQVPFGLMNNQTLPKLLRDDGETTHL